MPNVTARTVVGITDTQVKNLFVLLGQIIEKTAIFSVTGFPGNLAPDDDDFNKILKQSSDAIKSASISGQGFQVYFYSRSVIQGESGQVQHHPYYSIISVSIDDWYSHQSNVPQPNYAAALECNLQISKFIKRYHISAGLLAKNDRDLIEPHLALISQIVASSVNQIARTNEYFNELVERFDGRHTELNSQIASQKKDLDDEYHARIGAIKEEKEKLASERKELDDRTNTHARRAIRGELITTLQGRQSNFSISKDTNALRIPIHIVFQLLLASTFIGAAWSLYIWGTNPSDSYGAIAVTSAAKSVVFTFGFLTTAGLYISWMNRWFDKHADAQFQTKQFEIDINRASWAVEAALEWKGAQGEQMPDVLLAGITKHLFETTAAESADYSPLEALATSILGSASNLNLDVNGNKLTLDRKSIKEIKKTGQ